MGENIGWAAQKIVDLYVDKAQYPANPMIYSEHNDAYLQECLENLRGKGINIQM